MVRLDADVTLVPDQLLIDLQPLLAEIATDTISNQEDFQAADEFLLLRDLLADDEFEKLCETLFHFLWSEAQRGAASAVVQRGDEGKIWVDPDRRLVRVWFATNRKPVKSDDVLKVHGMHALPREVFWAGLARKLENWWDAGQRNLFVLIHGFNVSFEEAAVRAAQIGYDLKVPGEMAFYSWPSHI